jgi:WD40-like Beta Propeller Repeat
MREPVPSPGRRGVLAAVAGAVAALALAVPAAHAADDCPNAAVRAAQNGTQLPECRAYEQVSDTFKNGNAIRNDLQAVSPAGGLLMYVNNTSFGDALSNVVSREVARRGPSGWTSTSMLPALNDRLPTLNDSPYLGAISPTFDSAIYTTIYPLSPDDRGTMYPGLEKTNNDIYQYGADGSLSWLSKPPVLPDTSATEVLFTRASADLTRVIVETDRALDPAFPGLTTRQFYMIVDKHQPRLLSVLPDGTPSDGVFDDNNKRSTYADAGFTRVVFKTAANDRLYVREHADDPAAAQTRELTLGAAGASCSSPDIIRLTPDGRRLIVACVGDGAEPDPTAAMQSLYLADVDTGAVTRLPVTGTVMASSPDLSRIWVASADRALPGAKDGNLYLIRNGELSLAAAYPTGGVAATASFPGVLSADGDQIVFTSDQDLGFPNGGTDQVYRYDATVGASSLSCVSCRPDGVAATAAGQLTAPDGGSSAAAPGAISSDGRRVFFSTPTRLLPGDTNGVMDAYLWVDGKAHLLSSGRSPVRSAWVGSSADGSEAYFTTTESLVPQDVDSGVGDLYSATVDGGFAVKADAASCTTGCQGPGKVLDPLPTPGTAAFTGPADVDPDAASRPATLVKVFSVEGIGATARATWARGRTASVRVRLSHPGTATAVMTARIGKRSVVVARVSRTAKGGGTLALPLRLSKRARTALAREGVLRTTVRVTVPGAGAAQSASFVLRTAKAKRGRR